MEETETSTTNSENSHSQAQEDQQGRRHLSLEVVGEIILLAIVGGLFIYFFIASFKWPLGSALMPWITIAVGAPFLLYRLIVICLRLKEPSSQIMDLGFRTGADPKGERKRMFRMCLYISGLYLSIWLLGFHIALPAGVFFYIFVYGRVGWFWSLSVSLMFLAIIIGVFDRLLTVTWHNPPLLDWLRALL